MSNREMPPLPPPPVEEGSESEKKPAVAPSKMRTIEVVALAKGVWLCHRKDVGDKFTISIKSLDQIGTWMKCTDPQLQKEHERTMDEKKKKIRKMQAESK